MKRYDFNQHPFLVVWELTRACSRPCVELSRRIPQPAELKTEEALGFIDQVATANPAFLILTGGGPMERADLKEIVAYAAEKNVRVVLSLGPTPNLVQLNLQELKALGVVRLSLSLDGATRNSHDSFRGIAGAWDCTMRAIEEAKNAGMELQINTTFTRQNVLELESIMRLLADLKPVLWNVFQMLPGADPETLLTGTELEALFKRMAQLSLTVPYEIQTTEGPQFRRVALQNKTHSALENHLPIAINDGKGLVFVSSTGEVSPGGFLPLVVGNVRETELLDLYQNSRIFRELRDPGLLKGKCGYCDFNSICGGSRARAYATTGDYLAEDPLCIYQTKRSSSGDSEPWRMYCDD